MRSNLDAFAGCTCSGTNAYAAQHPDRLSAELKVMLPLRTASERVVLHAPDAGRPFYQSLGFKPTNEMRWFPTP